MTKDENSKTKKQHGITRTVSTKDKVKELIGRSPDYSDALMMREWFELSTVRRPTKAAGAF